MESQNSVNLPEAGVRLLAPPAWNRLVHHLAAVVPLYFPSMPAPDRPVSLQEPICRPELSHERAEGAGEVVAVAGEGLLPAEAF